MRLPLYSVYLLQNQFLNHQIHLFIITFLDVILAQQEIITDFKVGFDV